MGPAARYWCHEAQRPDEAKAKDEAKSQAASAAKARKPHPMIPLPAAWEREGAIDDAEGGLHHRPRMVNTNMMGAIRTTKAFIPHFREKRAGLFINPTSIGGLITVPFNSIYHARKWALEGWSESMAFELNQLGIGMKTVSPGGMKTDSFTRSLDAGRHPAYDAVVDRSMSVVTDDAKATYATRLELGDEAFRKATAAFLWSRNRGGSMNMLIALTSPVSDFFEAERTQDVEALARCFSEHATVRDEGRTIEGPDAIKRWMKEAKAKYHHTVEPLAVSHRDGLTVVTTRVAGTFPNSPLDLQHAFAVEAGKIASLEIG